MDLEKAYRESQALDAIYADIALRAAARNAAFTSRWPHHCAACGGWGLVGQHDPCEALPETQCHRCGLHGMSGDSACSFCGWKYDDGIENPFGGSHERV